MRARFALAVLLVATLASAPISAAEKFVAIGDSITAGSSWPVVSCGGLCPVVFDCAFEPSCDATASKRDNCGFVKRLDTWLGAGYAVVNEGVGGEKTAGAVSRFAGEMDAECPGSPGDCVAVLLMHGTNDMEGSVSPESARANLQLMVDEAKARNIDVLLMTIIRRGEDPSNSKWRAYRDEILDLAADESLVSVNPWLTLCPSQSCFNDNYWLENTSPCNNPDAVPHPGHLDSDGYDVITDLIQDAFPGSTPAAPTPTSPSGDIGDATPDFTWPEVAAARWYELEVDGSSTWWEAAAHCGGGSCTANPGVVLAEGSHSWKVRGRNLRGLGDWSGATDFEVWAVPGVPVPDVPSGLYVDDMPQSAPFPWEPYTWSEEAEATDYDLVVSDIGGTVFMQSFDSSICAGSVCEAEPAQGLDAGEYSWTVQARNPGASGPASAPLEFEVYDGLPGEATPTAPTGEFFEPLAPLYEWLPAPGAEEYDLEVKDGMGNVDASASGLLATTVCSGGVCSYQGGTLADPDDYTLRVLGRNSLGDGPWSSTGADFTVLACSDPTEKDLADFFTSGAVGPGAELEHCGPLTAAALGSFEIEAAGELEAFTRETFRAYDGFTVKGEFALHTQ